MRVIAGSSADPSQIDLTVFLEDLDAFSDPSVIVTEPASEVGHAPTMSYSSITGAWEGQISFSVTERGMGRIRASAAVGNSLARLQSTYRLQRVLNNQEHDVFSDDGNLSLHLAPDSLPGDEAFFVVMPPGASPGPAPPGLMLVGDPYDVTASGALTTLEQPAVLKLRYDDALITRLETLEGVGIYRWDPNTDTWQATPAVLDEGQKAFIASATTLGTYALLAPIPLPRLNYLPVILQTRSGY
jgi:hypothetical protein